MKKFCSIFCMIILMGVSIHSLVLLYDLEDSYELEINSDEMEQFGYGNDETYIITKGNLSEIIQIDGTVSSYDETPIISYTISGKKSEIKSNVNVNDVIEKNTVFAEYNSEKYVVDDKVRCVDIIENQDTTVYEFYDYSSIYISASIAEKNIDKVYKGQQVRISNRDKEFYGEIAYIDYYSNNGYVDVKIKYSENDEVLRVGSLCDIEITLQQKEDVFIVPSYYVIYIEAENSYKLQRKQGEGSILTNVSVGIISEEYVEILSEIEEGEVVVTPRYEMSLAYYMDNH